MELPLRRTARSAAEAQAEATITMSASAGWIPRFTDFYSDLSFRTASSCFSSMQRCCRRKAGPSRLEAVRNDSPLMLNNGFSSQSLLDLRRHATVIIRKCDLPSSRLQLVTCILHDKRDSGEGKHLRVIMIITDGHDLRARNSTMPRPPFQSVSLRTIAVEHINDRE